jgi:4'-phosphopantetheinyl transferase
MIMDRETTPAIFWKTYPDRLRMTEREVHVWRADLHASSSVQERLVACLSAEEKSRAERFVFARDRDFWVACRGILRQILSLYLDEHPGNIEFIREPAGKPRLGPYRQSSEPPIMFNVSHSNGLALVALTLEQEVGIDLEKVRSEFATHEIAERYFSRQEQAEFRSLPDELQTEAFFLCWTRKEAFVKARGEGLQVPLDSFAVSLTPGRPEVLTSADTERWQMFSFSPAPSYVAALVTEGRKTERYFWEWQPKGSSGVPAELPAQET